MSMMLTYEEQLNQNLDWALREGSMHFEEGSAVHKTLRRIASRLDEIGVDYAIAGGMALFLHGFRRFTEDVDVLVTPEGLTQLHEALDGLGYVRPFEKSKNLRDAETGVKIDFLVSGHFPGDGKPGPIAFPNPRDAAEDRAGLRVVTLERLIELKLASGQASHRAGDLNDVQRLIQALNLPLEFSDRLNAAIRDAYRTKWNDAQIAKASDS
jgi:hypothetical protein